MMFAEYLKLYEDAGPKMKQLKLAVKELGLSSKLKLGAFNNDELVERCVHAFNTAPSPYDVIQALDGLITNYKGVRDSSSFTYYLGRLKTLAPSTMFSNSRLDHWISSFSTVASAGHEIKETAVAAKSMMEVLAEMWTLARSKTEDAHKISFARANLRSLGITKGMEPK